MTFVHANLCMYILASTFQDGGNPFPVTRLHVLNSVTDLSRHTLLLPALHSKWSSQVYTVQQRIIGFLVVQEPTCMHAHEYRLLGVACFFFLHVTFVHANLCQPANFYNYAKNELQIKTIFFQFLAGIELATSG